MDANTCFVLCLLIVCATALGFFITAVAGGCEFGLNTEPPPRLPPSVANQVTRR